MPKPKPQGKAPGKAGSATNRSNAFSISPGSGMRKDIKMSVKKGK